MPYFSGLYYMLSDHGKKESCPLVLVHGAGGSCLSWPPHIRRLPGQTVLAVDLPGHGKSEGTSCQSIKEYAEVLLSWLDKQNIERFALCGHSMGGAISLTLALQEQKRVEKLILIGCAARLRVNPQLLELASHQSTLQKAVTLLVQWSFAPQASPTLIDKTTRLLSEVRFPVLYNDLLACNAFDLTDHLASIQSHSLVLVGADDKMTPVWQGKMLADSLPDVHFEIIPAAGHMVILEYPQLVADHILSFLQNGHS